MEISNIKGQGPLERPNGRDRVGAQDTARVRKDPPAPSGGEAAQDEAVISSRGKETLATVEALTERARRGDDRTEVVDAARARLESGALDNPQTYRAVAESMLREGLV